MSTDENLLLNIAKGDSKSFELLFYKHKNAVFGLSLRLLGTRMLAEENSQESWIRVVRCAHQFEPRRPVLSWILAITKNLALNTLQKRGWESELDPDTEQSIPWSGEELSDTLEKVNSIESLKEAIQQLPDRQRVALVLWMYEEKSYSELAQELGIAVNAVKVLLFRAKENIKKWARTSS